MRNNLKKVAYNRLDKEGFVYDRDILQPPGKAEIWFDVNELETAGRNLLSEPVSKRNIVKPLPFVDIGIIDFDFEGEKILKTGKYTYHKKEYDLDLLSRMSNRLIIEISESKNENSYSREVITIAMQMRKKALELILEDNKASINKGILAILETKKEELDTLIETQTKLKEKGIILSSTCVTKESDIYIKALQKELEKQVEIDKEDKIR